MNDLLSPLYTFRELMVNHVEHPFARLLLCLLIISAVILVLKLTWSFLLNRIQRKVLRQKWCATPVHIIARSRVFDRLFHVVALVAYWILVSVLFDDGVLRTVLLRVNECYFAYICANFFSATLTIVYEISNWRRGVEASPLKGLFQVLSLVGYMLAGVTIISTIAGRDPTFILSGMTALSAVLMLIFKDSILGLTAGITLAGNKMVQIGDWIEVPGANADGDVVDIALTTVRVRNWDKTITSIPSYDLIAKPFKNWRGMTESGGRRIKRSILIDLDSVAFADDAMLARWQKIECLEAYLTARLEEIAAYNAARPATKESIVNARKLTNIGTFRAYCEAYLRAHPKIHQGLTLIVRQLNPTNTGLPLEIYCFTNDTRWANYEGIQSDIFDHLLAIMPEFGLRCFQATSASALRDFAGKLSQSR